MTCKRAGYERAAVRLSLGLPISGAGVVTAPALDQPRSRAGRCHRRGQVEAGRRPGRQRACAEVREPAF